MTPLSFRRPWPGRLSITAVSILLLCHNASPRPTSNLDAGLPPMFFGVDYYPEQWDFEMIDEDMHRIKHELGADVIRIGEFSWHLVEPRNGHFEFDFWDHILKRAKEHGLKVMFGTPTATMPSWLARAYPAVLSVGADGLTRVFGGRRQYSFNSVLYRQYAMRITTKLLQRYGMEENIFSWQIDNEFGHEGSEDDYSLASENAWHLWLETTYEKNISRLNQEWGNVFWSQTYNKFEDIPMPLQTITTHNPALKVDWRRFRTDSILAFLEEQVKIVQEHVHDNAIITTNLPGGFFSKKMDFAKISRAVDVISYDNYPVWGGQEEPLHPGRIGLHLDLSRGMLPTTSSPPQDNGGGGDVEGRDREDDQGMRRRGPPARRAFWIAEELIGAQGHDDIGYTPHPGEAAAWAVQSLLHGASGLMFFRWRTAARGQEQFCYGILNVDNKSCRRLREARKVFSFGRRFSPILGVPIRARVAVVYSYDSVFAWQSQMQSARMDLEYEPFRLYQPFWRTGVPIDALDGNDPATISLIGRAITDSGKAAAASHAKDGANDGVSIDHGNKTSSAPADGPYYSVIILPAPIALPPGLFAALERHVQMGGSLYFSFRPDLKDTDMSIRKYSRLAKLAGVSIEEFESLNTQTVPLTPGPGYIASYPPPPPPRRSRWGWGRRKAPRRQDTSSSKGGGGRRNSRVKRKSGSKTAPKESEGQFKASVWRDLLRVEVPDEVEVVYAYADDAHSDDLEGDDWHVFGEDCGILGNTPCRVSQDGVGVEGGGGHGGAGEKIGVPRVSFADYAAITRRRFGRGGAGGGEVVYVGCGVEPEALYPLVKRTLVNQGLLSKSEAKLLTPETPSSIEIVRKTDVADREWVFVTNFASRLQKWRNASILPYETRVFPPKSYPSPRALVPSHFGAVRHKKNSRAYDRPPRRCAAPGLDTESAMGRLSRDPHFNAFENLLLRRHRRR